LKMIAPDFKNYLSDVVSTNLYLPGMFATTFTPVFTL